MGIKDCRDEIKKAAGGKLDDETIDSIAREVDARARAKRARDASLSDTGALSEAADDFSKGEAAARAVLHRNRALDILRQKARADFYDQAIADGFRPDQALQAKEAGIQRDMKGGRLSTDAKFKANEGFLLGGFIGDLRKAGLLGLFDKRLGVMGDGAGITDLDLNRALWSIGDDGKAADPRVSAQVKQMAEIMHKWQEISRKRRNSAGAAIGKDPNYIGRQAWDDTAIRSMSQDDFNKLMLDTLNPDKTFEGKDPAAFLGAAKSAMGSGVHIRESGNFGFKGPGNLAKRISHDRVLYFKDADAFTKANQAIGLRSTAEAFIAGLRRDANDIALMDDWGTNPRQNFEDDLKMLKYKHRDNPDFVSGGKLRNEGRLRNIFDNLDGTVNVADNASLAKWSANLRGLQDVAKLPLAAVSHLNILATAVSELRHEGEPLGKAYTDFLSRWIENAPAKDRMGIVADIGVGYESMAGTIASRFGAADQQPGTMSRVLRSYFKLNGMRFMIETSRSAFGQVLGHNLGRDAALPFESLNRDKQLLLQQYGIDASRWGVLRQGVRELEDGRNYLSPDAVAELPDEAFKPLGASTASGVRRGREALSTQLRALIADRTDHAIPTPGARERAIMNQGLRRGTVPGEIARLAWQFKQFPLSMWTRVVEREIGKFRDGRGDVLGVAHVIAANMVMGMLAMQCKQILKGRTPRDPFDGNWPSVWTAALQQSAGAGIYGDFLFGQYSDFGGSPLETLAGPTLGTGSQALRTLVGLYTTKQTEDGLEPTTTPGDVLRLATDNMPNLFYTRIGLNYLILYQLQEMASPGYLRRMEQRLKQQDNQEMFLPPSTIIPQGGGALFSDNRLINGQAFQ